MPPYAICFTDRCDYLFDFNENENNLPSCLPPHQCPKCKGRVIFYCRVCRWPILTVPDVQRPRCGNCTAMLRDNGKMSQLSHGIVSNSKDGEDIHDSRIVLTRRELDVLRLLATGNGNKEAASVLGISEKTVGSYRWRIMMKINAPSIAHLIHYAIRHHIVEIQR
jgi:DNA-binding CsgD family transcriptional regulator